MMVIYGGVPDASFEYLGNRVVIRRSGNDQNEFVVTIGDKIYQARGTLSEVKEIVQRRIKQSDES